jgi:hypothetical protein
MNPPLGFGRRSSSTFALSGSIEFGKSPILRRTTG